MRGRLCYFPTRWLWAVSLPPVPKWRSCAELHTKMVNIIEIHSSCSDWFDDNVTVPRCYQNFHEKSLNLSVGTCNKQHFHVFEVTSHSWWTSIVLFPGVQLNLSRSHSYDFSLQRKDHIHGGLCTFPKQFSSAWFQMATLCRTSHGDGQRYARMCLDNHAAVPRAKVRKLLSKSLTNLDPPSARQNLRRDRALWVIIDSAIPAVDQHFLASRPPYQRWNWKQFYCVSRCELRCLSSQKARSTFSTLFVSQNHHLKPMSSMYSSHHLENQRQVRGPE